MTTTSTEKAPQVDAVLDAILGRITDPGAAESVKMMIYSDPGGRKTTFTGTIPANLIHDVEEGTSVLKAPLPILKKDVKVLPYTSFYQVEELIKRLQEKAPGLDPFETYTVDSMSALHKRGLAETVEREWKKSPTTVNRYVAETEHHTENNEHIRRLVDAMKDLDRNIVITAHARSVAQKDGSIKIYPDFSEKLANTLAGIMDIVGYMTVKEVDGKTVGVMRVKSNGFIACKTRFTNMPSELIDPTWDMIMQYRDDFLKSNPVD